MWLGPTSTAFIVQKEYYEKDLRTTIRIEYVGLNYPTRLSIYPIDQVTLVTDYSFYSFIPIYIIATLEPADHPRSSDLHPTSLPTITILV